MQCSKVPSHSCHWERIGADIQQICGLEANCLLSSWFLRPPYFRQSIYTLSTEVMEGSAKQVWDVKKLCICRRNVCMHCVINCSLIALSCGRKGPLCAEHLWSKLVNEISLRSGFVGTGNLGHHFDLLIWTVFWGTMHCTLALKSLWTGWAVVLLRGIMSVTAERLCANLLHRG